MRSFLYRSLGALVLLLAVVPAFATITTFSTYSSWSAVVTGISTITFDNLSQNQGLPNVVLPPVIFTTWDNTNNLTIGDTFGAACSGKCLKDRRSTGVDTGGITATHSNGPTALGFNVFDSAGLDVSITITFVSNSTPYTTSVRPKDNFFTPTVFFGVTSTDQIATITMTTTIATGTGNAPLAIDNYVFGDFQAPVTDTPESASLGYVGLGLAALLLGSRRQSLRNLGRR